MMRKELKFRVSSALKSIVGQDLITDDFVAVFELVKNAIDAKASKIDLYFDLDAQDPSIYIVDNGKGMSLEDIEQKWLFLGYSAKREGVEDEELTTYAGNKGVGRFSCDRLGGHLEIQSKTKNCKTAHKILADWSEFEKSSKDEFGDVSIVYEEVKSFNFPKEIKTHKNGLAIKISELRAVSSWSRKKLLKLKRNLAKLVSPFGGEKQSHTIKLHCSREAGKDHHIFEEKGIDEATALIVNGVVENRIFDILNTKTTKLEAFIKKGYLYTTLTDRGVVIYEIREKLNEKYNELLDADFSSELFYLNHSAKITFKRRMGLESYNFGDVFLYRNGYQVVPVGEVEDDFWAIERRKGQGYNRYLSGRELMGRVLISGPESKFRESSSRDKGLIDTPAAIALKDLFMVLIRKFERYVAQISWKDKLDQELDTPERLSNKDRKEALTKLISDLSKSKEVEVLEYNKDLVKILNSKVSGYEASLQPLRTIAEAQGDSKLLDQVVKAEKTLKKAKKEAIAERIVAEKQSEAREVAEEKASGLEKQTLLLQSLHARDDQLHQSQHLIPQYAQSVLEYSEALYKSMKNHPEPLPEKWMVHLSSVIKLTQMIQKLTKFNLHANYKSKTDFLHGDVVLFIQNYIENVLEGGVNGENRRKVAINFENPLQLEHDKEFQPIRLSIILDNLFFNAAKHGAKSIKVMISHGVEVEGSLMVSVVDDGRGVSATNSDKIFDQGYTTTKGSGLGLYHVRQLVEGMKGAVSLDAGYGSGAKFDILIK